MKRIFFLVTVGVFGLTACKTEGCTNPLASNFNADAEKDNGSCTYESDILVYLDETDASLYQGDHPDMDHIKIFLDGAEIGKQSIFKSKTLFPECGDTACFNHKVQLKDVTETGFRIDFVDNLDNERGGITFNLEASECKVFRINYVD
ncbi:hypothetical protein [Crocinitomix algicola]|uniref:hypothetical protein n=1 Tax=Crocinitomix algicola TaxID=1740263 RepID=UPI0008721A19|nr:hypothetical protein [Crocinitomix algicola]